LEHIAKGFMKVKDKYGPQSLISHVGRGGFEQGTTDFIGVSNP